MIRSLFLTSLLFACSPAKSATSGTEAAPPLKKGQAEAIFAGGCFWCMEKPFESIDGVKSVVSGYTGGKIEGPTYQQVGAHATEHREAIRVVYDPKKVNYDQLLSVFWHNIDPLQDDGQFCDRGHQYTSAIYVGNDEERAKAEASRTAVAAQLKATVVTEIEPASTFWLAEDYHQDFYKTNPVRYYSYRRGCGRDARLEFLWGEQAGH